MNTLADLHEILRRYTGNDGTPSKSAAVVSAAKQALDRIGVYHDWYFYQTWGRTITSAPYQDGTISFDFTGGAEERLVTLTGGVFPDWAAQGGTISVNNIPYDVDKRLSDTTLTLKVNQTPGVDLPSGTVYLLYRAQYDLPADCAGIDRPILSSSTRIIPKVSLNEFITRRNWNESIAEPMMFAIAVGPYGNSQILLWQPPDAVYSLEYQYKRKAAIPTIAEESRGKLTLTATSTTVAGKTTAFSQAMAGCVLRVSYDDKVPTSVEGTSPFQYEYIIDSVQSPTSLTLTAPAIASVGNRGFTISSRLDVDDGPMMMLLVKMGMKNLRIALRINMTNEELPEYERAVLEAKSYDGQRYKGQDSAQRVIAGTRPWGYMKTEQ